MYVTHRKRESDIYDERDDHTERQTGTKMESIIIQPHVHINVGGRVPFSFVIFFFRFHHSDAKPPVTNAFCLEGFSLSCVCV